MVEQGKSQIKEDVESHNRQRPEKNITSKRRSLNTKHDT